MSASNGGLRGVITQEVGQASGSRPTTLDPTAAAFERRRPMSAVLYLRKFSNISVSSSSQDTESDADSTASCLALDITIAQRCTNSIHGPPTQILLNDFDNETRTFIDTQRQLENFLPLLADLVTSTPEAPELACDCEGRNLGRQGSLTIFQMRIRSMSHTYVFDVLALHGRDMFDHEVKG